MNTMNKFALLIEQLQQLHDIKSAMVVMADKLSLSERDKLDILAITKRMEKKIKKQMIEIANQ